MILKPDITFPASLKIYIVVIIHDLTHAPIISIHDFLKEVDFIMKGKPRIANLSIINGFCKEFKCSESFQLIPGEAIQGMEKVEVKKIRSKPGELLIQETFHIAG